MEILYKDALLESVEFSQQQVDTVAVEKPSSRNQIPHWGNYQTLGRRSHSGIPKKANKVPETAVKAFYADPPEAPRPSPSIVFTAWEGSLLTDAHPD